mmetsp:Transcript_114395/g.330521  ORF Transcript_114395/g.330521 Transcript_114395/m.330521 type:complete len:134 (-) Transcript_114395:1042-1443(-)
MQPLLGLALGLLTASRATTTATAAYLPSAADLQQAQKVDDECMADDGSACALNALQLRGKSVETPLPLPTLVAPDFTLRRVGGVIDKEADDEDEDEEPIHPQPADERRHQHRVQHALQWHGHARDRRTSVAVP